MPSWADKKPSELPQRKKWNLQGKKNGTKLQFHVPPNHTPIKQNQSMVGISIK